MLVAITTHAASIAPKNKGNLKVGRLAIPCLFILHVFVALCRRSYRNVPAPPHGRTSDSAPLGPAFVQQPLASHTASMDIESWTGISGDTLPRCV